MSDLDKAAWAKARAAWPLYAWDKDTRLHLEAALWLIRRELAALEKKEL